MTLLTAVAELAVMYVLTAMACDTGRTNLCCVCVFRCGLPMTTLARYLAVRTFKPVGRPAVVVKVPNGPSTGVVTGFAAHSKFLFVFVFILVARKAISLRIFVTTCCMAILARRRNMPPRQWKTRLCMVELRGLPGLVTVALLTLDAQLILVLVVLLVAAVTVHGGVAVTAKVFVTGVTFDFRIGMGIAQFELAAIVVEAPLGAFPVAFGMAFGALFPQIAHVLVVFLVAADALLGCLLEHRTLVALLAIGLCVLAQQREGRRLMVEFRRLLPVAFGVAIATLLAKGLLVLVVFLVAAVALLARFHLVQVPCVAVCTGGGAMLAAQGIACVGIVVER